MTIDPQILGVRKWPKNEMVARCLAAAEGLNPEALVTKSALWEAHGLRVIPNDAYIAPAWTHFMYTADNILACIEEWDKA